MLDESCLVAGFTATASEPIFQRREWTHPSCEFDERPPQRSRYVEPCDASPSKHQKAPNHHKQHESHMEQYHEIGERPINHPLFLRGAVSQNRGAEGSIL